MRILASMFQKCYIFVTEKLQTNFKSVTQLNILTMKRIMYMLMMCVIALTATAQYNSVSSIVEKDGVYFTDATQTQLYSGEYREYYDNGSLKLEMQIKNGSPEGTYVVYFDNNKPKEIRSYKNGQFHGVWRSYNVDGLLISEAEYKNDKKHGLWRIWDEKGVLRYEMHYNNGNKTGVWKMWNEKAELTGEKKYTFG